MNEDFRKQPPAILAERPLTIAKPFKTTLENGLKVVIFEDSKLPLVSFRLAFRFGEINDETRQLSILTSMMKEGTEKFSSKQLADKIDDMGASLNLGSSSDDSILAASSLSNFRKDILDLMAEVLFNPTFPEGELELKKQNSIESLKFSRSDAAFLADERFSKIVYGDHPYSVGNPTIPQIEQITRESLMSLHGEVFIPNNATLLVVGDVKTDDLLEEIRGVFGGWTQGTVGKSEFKAVPVRSVRTLTIVNRADSAQSNIVIGNIGINRTHEDYFPCIVMNQILGSGATSRLFMNIREDKGYTYGAYSSFDSRRLTGSFEATAEVRNEVTGAAMKEFFYELERIRETDVSEDDLSLAQSYLSGVFPLRVETLEGLMGQLVNKELYDLPENYLENYRENVSNVTIADVKRVANKYIDVDKIAIVVVGATDEILPQIKEYSEVIEIFDTEGNLKS
jgi:zinc protease